MRFKTQNPDNSSRKAGVIRIFFKLHQSLLRYKDFSLFLNIGGWVGNVVLTAALQDPYASLEDIVKVFLSDMFAEEESLTSWIHELVSDHAGAYLDIYPVRYDDFFSGER